MTNKRESFQSDRTEMTVTHEEDLVSISLFQPSQNFCTILKTCALLDILSPKLTACVI